MSGNGEKERDKDSYYAVRLEGEVGVWNVRKNKIHALCQSEKGKWMIQEKDKSSEQASRKVPNNQLSIVDQVFVRYIRQLHLALSENLSERKYWLVKMLEAAYEVDFLTGILLGCIDRSKHQAALDKLGSYREGWFTSEGMCRTKKKGGFIRGSFWLCKWVTNAGEDTSETHELWVFTETSAPKVVPAICAWYLERRAPNDPGQLQPLELTNGAVHSPQLQRAWVPVTKEQAVEFLAYTTAYGRCFPTIQSQQAIFHKAFLEKHRLEKFPLALKLARDSGGNAASSGSGVDYSDHEEMKSRLENEVKKLKASMKELEEQLRVNRSNSDVMGHQPANFQVSNLPSVEEAERDCEAIVQKLKDIYFDFFHGKASSDAKASLGRCVSSMVTGMFNIAQHRYDGMLSAMSRVLGVKRGPGEDAKAAFDYYCRRNWKELFLEHSTGSRCDISVQTDEKIEKVQQRADVYDPFDLDGSDDEYQGGGIVTYDDENAFSSPDGISANSAKPDTGTELATLRKSVILMFKSSIPSESKVALDVFQACFDDLWRITVILFLQNPQYRFWGNYPVVGQYNDREHQNVDLGLKSGQKIVVLVPPFMRSPKGKSLRNDNGSIEEGWVVRRKAHVDSLE